MTIVGLSMLFVFGFFAIRHFRNGRVVWGVFAAIGSLLGAGSLWTDYERAKRSASEPVEAGQPVAVDEDAELDPEEPVIGEYQPVN